MSSKIKNTATIFVKTSRGFLLAGVWLTALLAVGYFTLQSPKAALNDCTNTTFNTAYPPNICNPVACSSLSANNAKTVDNNGGNYNCYYAPQGNPLPPCKLYTGADGKKPRINCADLIDLPLCSIFSAENRSPGVNCVSTCDQISDPDPSANPPNVRGFHYAVFNKECIRFCNDPEAGSGTMVSGSNCTAKKCQQLTSLETPDKNNNCSILPCNLLSLDELKVSDNRFENDTKQYCDGSNVKCYNFFNNTNVNEANTDTNNSDNLKYIRYRLDNPMCQIHQCRPDAPTCGVDDTQNVINKGVAYQNDYITYINAGMPVESGLCEAVLCKPIMFQRYRCHNTALPPSMDDDPENLTELNPLCDHCIDCAPNDSSCNIAQNGCAIGTKPQTCGDCIPCSASESCLGEGICPAGTQPENSGYCTKKIDCNLTANSNQAECLTSAPDNVSLVNEDPFDAWLFRPTPPGRITSNNGVINVTIGGDRNSTQDINRYCYTTSNIREDNDWGDEFWGIWHHYITEGTRSPQHCTVRHDGTRGNGYAYLAGTNGNIYHKPSSSAGYIKGKAQVNYELIYPEYNITACLRYKNAMRLDIAGKRECKISCVLNKCQSQMCGFDVCRDMTIKADNIDECSLETNQSLFTGNSANCASSTIDSYVRMRARKYGRRICVFLDLKGTLAYNPQYFNGEETLSDGTCVDGGPKDADGKCNGFNTNSNKGLADRWRTLMKIQYIGNNRPQNPYGYLDYYGKFFPEQECAKIPLRIGPPKLYGIGNISNSKNLFEPPLFILNVREKRGGAVVDPTPGDQLGTTNFFYPEIVIQYGGVQQKMSLSTGHIGKDDSNPEDYPSSPWSKIINTSISGSSYTADIFVNKEYDQTNNRPIFCLYRRFNDEFGMPMDPVKISCVNRNKPLISEIVGNEVVMDSLITPDPSNIFNSAKMNFQLIADRGANNQNDDCSGDDICSNQITFQNPNVSTPSCNNSIEAYRFCSKRDECSKLYSECAQNEIDLYTALSSGHPTSTFNIIKNECSVLRTNCNLKMGIIDSSAPDFFTQNSTNSPVDPRYTNAYGWFNEMCIVGGFENQLKKVIAYRTVDGIKGKCQINVALSNPDTDCSKGGKAPDCVCQEAPLDPDYLPPPDQEIRTQTPREAGLCIDLPLPRFCPAINYVPTPNSDITDPYYTLSSVNNAINNHIYGPNYSNNNGVHTSHWTRRNATAYNHGEFSSIIGGTNNVYGNCNGFWKADTNSSGISLKPILNCAIDGTWNKPAGSPNCIRYSCPAVLTDGIQSNGVYQGGYDNGENGEDKGLRNGFATWERLDKTDDFTNNTQNADFLKNASAISCLAGFKPAGSTLQGNQFTGGTLPNRDCDQIGNWRAVNNACVRLSCPALTTASGSLSSNPVTQAQIDAWNNIGGAEFASVKASRSATSIRPESVAVGICRNNLGFVQISPNFPPKMKCNYLGQWEGLENPCATQCDAVDILHADATHGFATWNTATNVPLGGSVLAQATACKSGYFPNPYAPIDPNTNQPSLPTRNCQSVAVDNGWSTVWQQPSYPCTNSCLGQADFANNLPDDQKTDPAYNRGITREFVSASFTGTGSDGATRGADGKIAIYWNTTNPGNYDYYDSCALSPFNATQFAPNRTNGCIRLSRVCSSDHRTWGGAFPMCIADGGQVGNATYDANPSITGKLDAVAVNDVILTGTCVTPGFDVENGQSLPNVQCSYHDSNNNGIIEDNEKEVDKVYFKLVNNTNDCKAFCTMAQGTTIGNSIYTGTSAESKTFLGEALSLDCKSGFGKRISGSTRSVTLNETNVCEIGTRYSNDANNPNFNSPKFSMTDRFASRPTVTCNAGGIFSNTVTNDCSLCRTCPVNQSYYVTLPNGLNLMAGIAGCNAAGKDKYLVRGYAVGGAANNDRPINVLHASTTPATHNAYWSACQWQSHSPGTSGVLVAKCIDGRYFVKSQCYTGGTHYGNNNSWQTWCLGVGFYGLLGYPNNF